MASLLRVTAPHLSSLLPGGGAQPGSGCLSQLVPKKRGRKQEERGQADEFELSHPEEKPVNDSRCFAGLSFT